MAFININRGAIANDGTGDSIRSAFGTVNDNFQTFNDALFAGTKQSIISAASVTAGYVVSNTYVLASSYVNADSIVGNTVTSYGNLFVSQDGAYIVGNVNIIGNLNVTGSQISSASQNTEAPILELHYSATPLVSNDGKDIGTSWQYYDGGAEKFGFLGWQNTSESLVYLDDATITSNVVTAGTFGNVQFGSLELANATSSTSSTTGALIVAGGAGIAGDVNIDGNVSVANTGVVTTGNITVTGWHVGNMNFSGADTIYINGSPVQTAAAAFNGGTVGLATTFTDSTNSTSKTTGAVIVTGGLGVSGNTFVKDIHAVGNNAAFRGNLVGTLKTNAQPSVTSLGTLTSLTVSGQTTTGNIIPDSGNTHWLGQSGSAYLNAFINTLDVATITNTPTFSGVPHFQSNTLFTSTTASTNTTTGAIVVTGSGGIGVGGDINVGGTVDISNSDGDRAVNILNTSSTNDQTDYLNYTDFNITGTDTPSTARYKVTQFNDIDNSSTGGKDNLRLVGTWTDIDNSGDANQIWGTYNALRTAHTSNRVSYMYGDYNIVEADQSGTGNVYVAHGSHNNIYYGGTGDISYAVANNNRTLLQDGSGTATYAYGVLGEVELSANTTATEVIGIASIIDENGGTATNSYLYHGEYQGTPSAATAYGVYVDGEDDNYFSGNITAASYVNVTANVKASHFEGTSTQALYADLAEIYTTDQNYAPGTVVVVGGDAEVTASSEGERAIGIISTAPAFLMNKDADGQAVALKGRVPCKVVGAVTKGDALIAGNNGHAKRSEYRSYDTFAIALETSSETVSRVIEVLVL